MAMAGVLGIAQGVPVPLPVNFTNVHVDQYTLTADTLSIPGFVNYQQ